MKACLLIDDFGSWKVSFALSNPHKSTFDWRCAA